VSGFLAPRRIAIIGAECTGKTTLARALASHLPALWVPEHLRDFCAAHGRTPRADEQRDLVRRQVELEREALVRAAREAVGWVVCDSTPLATALYSAQLFGDETLLEAAIAHQRGYAVTLLAEPDLPWRADGIQRDGPEARSGFHERLLSLLASHRVPHRRISGDEKTRLATARSAVLSTRPI
jgi:NadR type nicotinamide-nucleotide adenylyltransferase